MIKVLIASHMKDTEDELQIRLDYRYEKLHNNPKYSVLVPHTTRLGELLVTFKSSCNLVKDNGGGSVLIGLKNKAKDELKQFVKFFNSVIEVEANKLASNEEAEAFATGTGADVQKAKSAAKKVEALTYLETPTGFKVVADEQKKGAYVGSWNAVKGAIIYVFEELDEAGNIKKTTLCDKASLFVSGTESGVIKYFRLKAVGADTITSDYTEIVIVWVR